MVVLQYTFINFKMSSYSSSEQASAFQMRYPFFALNEVATFTKYEPNFPEFNT